MAAIPTGNHIRAMLDPVDPSHLQPGFDACLAAPKTPGGLESFQRLDGRCLIALDGTGYFCSRKIGCPPSSNRRTAMTSRTANAPPPSAGSRGLKPVYPGGDLFACQPIAQAVLDQGGDFIFTCKPSSHKTLYDFSARPVISAGSTPCHCAAAQTPSHRPPAAVGKSRTKASMC